MSKAAIAMAVMGGIQGISTIQNARFQANLTEEKNKARMAEASFSATERELELERNRLNFAIEERERMRTAKKTIGNLVAKPLTVDISPVYQSHIADMVDDLTIIRTDLQIATKKSQAGTYNMMASVHSQNRMDTAMAKANRKASYLKAGMQMAGGYMNYKYMSAGSAGNLNPNSTATMSAGQLDMNQFAYKPYGRQ